MNRANVTSNVDGLPLWVTPRDIATHLRVSYRLAQVWCQSGRIKSRKTHAGRGGHWLVRRDWLDTFIESLNTDHMPRRVRTG